MIQLGEASDEDFDETDIGALSSKQAPNNEVTPSDAEKALAHATAQRVTDDNGHRSKLVLWTMWVVPASLLVNCGIFLLYLKSEWGEISDAVMIAWLTATVVEVLGIAYIIASDLFKDGSPNGRRSNSEE